MTTRYKTPAIVQCSLGDMRRQIPSQMGHKPRKLSRILLRIASQSVVPRATKARHDLALDIRDGSDATLRATLERLSERFQIMALLPPIGISSQHLHLGQTIAGLSDTLALPGFSKIAFATAMNRYLTRCHWQNAGLPTAAFSLVQSPSALDLAVATTGLPARLSPLHYALPRLEAHIQRNTETAKAYQLVARTLHRHTLTQPVSDLCNHHIRFSFATDQLIVAMPPGITLEFTLIIRNGIPRAASKLCGDTQFTINRASIAKMTQLAIEGCMALGIQTGIACCLIRHTETGDFLDGIIPNYIDDRCRNSSIGFG